MAMRQSEVRSISGHEYRITSLPATESRRLFFELAKLFGPVLQAAVPGASEDEQKASGVSAMAEALSAAPVELFDRACDTFAGVTQIDGVPRINTPERFDDFFSGQIGALIHWIQFCLEWEYGSFLDELLGSMKGSGSASETPKPEA